MGFDFNHHFQIPPYKLLDDEDRSRYEVCDALQFDSNGQVWSESKIYCEGYYREGFYMLYPLWYVQFFNKDAPVTDTLFLKISKDATLARIDVEQLEPRANPETIEYMQIVVFRNHHHPICHPRLGSDLSKGYDWRR